MARALEYVYCLFILLEAQHLIEARPNTLLYDKFVEEKLSLTQ